MDIEEITRIAAAFDPTQDRLKLFAPPAAYCTVESAKSSLRAAVMILENSGKPDAALRCLEAFQILSGLALNGGQQ